MYTNTILASVTNFVKHLHEYDEKSITELQQISGCGVAYTARGEMGFYKLLIEFGKPMRCVIKFDLAERHRPLAANLVDYSLDYFFGKLKQ